MKWWQDAIFYQIYPRSFRDANSDGIGDIPGIIEKLDYLNDGEGGGLGIDALWISPFFPSPMRDFGYDISDYEGIDPAFGTMHDFSRLLDEAHQRGIRIVIDLVVNHTSDEHPWFKEACASRDNPKHDWYLWQPSRGGKTPNNWISLIELKSAWWKNEATDEYYLGTFTRYQPELNWRNSDLRNAIYDSIRFWLNAGVDGFRMDVCTAYIKDDYFRSNPFSFNLVPDLFQKHIYDRNRPEFHEIFREIRKISEEFGDKVLIGETYGSDPRLAASCHGENDDELDMAFNFDFLSQPWSAAAFRRAAERYFAVLPSGAWPNFTLSNHDRIRHITRYRGSKHETSSGRAKIAIAMLLTLRGTPFLYYGEELGMKCYRLPRKRLRDPVGVKTWPLPFGRDPERTPMQWDAGQNAGFGKAEPWLPVNPDYRTTNVEAESRDPESLLSFYRKMIALRKEHPALREGKIAFLDRGRNILSFERSSDTEKLIVILNFTARSPRISLPARSRPIFGTKIRSKEGALEGSYTLGPLEILILETGRR